jgi:type IV secretory pathway TraG/TraD family ATPase VirD4
VRALQAGYQPSRPVLVLAAVLLSLLLSAVVALALWWTGRRPRGTSTPARWAKPAELRSLQVPATAAERPNRLPLGYVGRRLLAAKANHSVLVVGPVGSGKTESFAIGATLDHGGPAIVTSVKRDLIDATIDARSQLGPAYVFDPSRSTGRPCSTWSPLPQCADYDGAKLMARWLVEAARPTSGGSEVGEFFSTLARYLLASLLHAAALDKRPITDVRGYSSDRTMIAAWTCGSRGPATTTRGRPGSSNPGSRPTPTAWSGCAGRTASCALAATTPVGGRLVMAGTGAPAAGRVPR